MFKNKAVDILEKKTKTSYHTEGACLHYFICTKQYLFTSTTTQTSFSPKVLSDLVYNNLIHKNQERAKSDLTLDMFQAVSKTEASSQKKKKKLLQLGINLPPPLWRVDLAACD